MIIARNISKSVGINLLFQNVNLTFHSGDKVGVIGPNGSGKTTLLKILGGIESGQEGSVELLSERAVYVPQEFDGGDLRTVADYIHKDKHEILKSLKQLTVDSISMDGLLDNLSGGEQMKLKICAAIAQKPTTLLLDEPTNHLDFASLQWLINFIKDFKGIVIMVSHDRFVLNEVVNKIIEIDMVNLSVNSYDGNYSSYLEQRELLFRRNQIDYKLQEKKRSAMEQWISKRQQIASVKPSPAMGRQIQMMKKRLQREVFDNKIDKLKTYKPIQGGDLQGYVGSSKLILKIENLQKEIDGKLLLKGTNLELFGAERLLLNGKNGVGKTTLLKIILGKKDIDSGQIKLGKDIKIGYFDQKIALLDYSRTVIEEFRSIPHVHYSEQQARSVLAAFSFGPELIFREISKLSSGQRVRLVFAKLLHSDYHLLLLDEPSNHLDIETKEIIELALKNYEGALIVVSHDKYFIEQIGVTKTLYLQDGQLIEQSSY